MAYRLADDPRTLISTIPSTIISVASTTSPFETHLPYPPTIC